jgi:hypothetical protein
MPPSSPSSSSSPPDSSLGGLPQGPPSPIYEHEEPSKGFPVVNLSSEEEDVVLNTSQDDDITCMQFDDLNCGLLGLPDKGNVIIISDSEEEEVHEDNHAYTDAAPSSLRVSSASSISTVDDNDTPDGGGR